MTTATKAKAGTKKPAAKKSTKKPATKKPAAKKPTKKPETKKPASTSAKAPEKTEETNSSNTLEFSVTGKKKPDATAATLPMDEVKIQKGFNPRGDVGDITTLTKGVKTQGLINPITVRKIGKKFMVVAGHRRHAAVLASGRTNIQVVIRTDLDDDLKARAFAVAENSEDGRSNLNHIEMGRVFAEMAKAGDTIPVIATATGTHQRTVRRCLQIMDTPKDIQQKVVDNVLSTGAALEYARLDPKTRNAISDKIEEGMTAKHIKEAGKKAAKDAAATTATPSKDTAAAANQVAWRAKKDIQKEIREISHLVEAYESTEGYDADNAEYNQMRGALASLLWMRGDIMMSTLVNPDDAEGLPEGMNKKEATAMMKSYDKARQEAAKEQADIIAANEAGDK